ncbi:MAG: TetR/AcrR family transcriptional regulator [Pseudomonadota bacterium]
MGIRADKREALRRQLKSAARKRIAQHGLSSLRARDLASDVDRPVGSIYTAFKDLDDLILHVNADTMKELGSALSSPVENKDSKSAITALSIGYARFATENQNLWAALFEHKMPDGGPSPAWVLNHHSGLLDRLVQALRMMDPMAEPSLLERRAKTYFTAVHGVVTMSLQNRFLGVPRESLVEEITALVGVILAGLDASLVKKEQSGNGVKN